MLCCEECVWTYIALAGAAALQRHRRPRELLASITSETLTFCRRAAVQSSAPSVPDGSELTFCDADHCYDAI
jgi:hypothetical protein